MDEPKWRSRKREYNREYNKTNKVQVGIKLNRVTESELIEIFQAIPNKSEWLKNCLRQYAADHPEIYHTKEDPEDWPE